MKSRVLLSTILAAGLLSGPAFAAGTGQSAEAGQGQDMTTQAAQQEEQGGSAAGTDAAAGQTGAMSGEADTARVEVGEDEALADTIVENTEAVRMIQEALISQGHDVEADGQWGDNTQEALREFQEQAGIEADGMPNMATLDRLGLDVRPADQEPQAAQTPGQQPTTGGADAGAAGGADADAAGAADTGGATGTGTTGTGAAGTTTTD